MMTYDDDVLAVKNAIDALNHSTDRRTLRSNLEFLWDYFIGHPSKELPDHLKVNPQMRDET